MGFRLTLGLAAEVEDLCNPAREHGLVSMAVAQESIHANAAHLRVLHPRSACCVLRFGAACSVVLNVMSYTSAFDSTRESASEMTPDATSGVDGVLGGRELEPGAALYLCGPAIVQQKRHRPECGHTVKGARCYRLCAYSLVRQCEAAKVGIRRSTVPPRHGCQHEPAGYALAANFASGSKRTAGS